MNIKKILKGYLGATLILTTFSLLNYNDAFKQYISTAYVDVMSYRHNDTKSYLDPLKTLGQKPGNLVETDYRDNPSPILLKITNDPSKSMVYPGTKFANFMTFNFKDDQSKASLETLNLSIHGTAPENIKNAYLFEKKKVIAEATISDGYLKFSHIGYTLNPNAVSSLTLKLNLGENLKVGDILSLDIDQPSDLDIKLSGYTFALNGHYPIKGKYLSIVGSRL